MSFIFVDECHCCVQWSENFRPKYKDIDHLRSLFPSAKIIALTATASLKMQQEIQRVLNMKAPVIISAHSDRPNIKYSVCARPPHTGKGRGIEESFTSVFLPYVQELKSKRMNFPKTVVYCGLKWCGFGNELGVTILSDGQASRVDEVAQFHAPLSSKVNLMKTLNPFEYLYVESSTLFRRIHSSTLSSIQVTKSLRNYQLKQTASY